MIADLQGIRKVERAVLAADSGHTHESEFIGSNPVNRGTNYYLLNIAGISKFYVIGAEHVKHVFLE